MTAPQEYKPVFTFTLHNRTLQLTREGGGFVFMVLGVGLGAINTGNNLLYLILAMCCSFIAVSGILSEMTLRAIQVQGRLPKFLYAEEPTPVPFTITNGKRTMPSYSLHLELGPDPLGRFTVDEPVYLFHLPPGASVQKTIRLTALRRGPLRIQHGRLVTRFPFGFFVKTKHLSLNLETLVFPPIRPVQLPEPNEISSEGEGVLRQSGDQLYALREFRAGDPLASVHWKSSAKTGALRVKEFGGGGRHSFTIFLNLADPKSGQLVPEPILEERVIESASLAFHLIRRGDEVRLKTGGVDTAYGNSEQHLESILRVLALVGTPSSN